MSTALPPTVLLLVQAGISHDAGTARAVASCKSAIDRATGAHPRVPKALNLMCTLQIAAPFAQAYPAVAAELDAEFLAARKAATTALTAVHVKYLRKRLAALEADRAAGHAHLVQQLLTWGVAGHKTACELLPATTPAVTELSAIKTVPQYAALVLAAMGNRDTVTVPFRAALLAALGDTQAFYEPTQAWSTGAPLTGAHAAAYGPAAAPTHPKGVDAVAAPAHVETTSSLIIDTAMAVLHALGAVSQAATDRTAKAISKEMERSSTKAVTAKTAAEAQVVSANATPSVMVQQLVAREFATSSLLLPPNPRGLPASPAHPRPRVVASNAPRRSPRRPPPPPTSPTTTPTPPQVPPTAPAPARPVSDLPEPATATLPPSRKAKVAAPPARPSLTACSANANPRRSRRVRVPLLPPLAKPAQAVPAARRRRRAQKTGKLSSPSRGAAAPATNCTPCRSSHSCGDTVSSSAVRPTSRGCARHLMGPPRQAPTVQRNHSVWPQARYRRQQHGCQCRVPRPHPQRHHRPPGVKPFVGQRTQVHTTDPPLSPQLGGPDRCGGRATTVV